MAHTASPTPDERRPWTRDDLVELSAVAVALALIGYVFSVFARAVELRPGVVLNDPVLAWIAPRDMTGVIFAAMYASVALGVLSLRHQPRAFINGWRAYAILVLLRIIAMALTPLDPPLHTIPLSDPVVERISGGQVLTHDLFFSGHTGTVCVILFAVRDRATRTFLLAAAFIVGVSVLVQRVHYTIDVLAAPPFAYAAYRIAQATAGHRREREALPVGSAAGETPASFKGSSQGVGREAG